MNGFRRVVLFVIFAGTGFSALTLQVVWQRVISMHGGVDLFSTTTVVAAFLGGLGIGSLAGGALADRLGARRSVMAFAAANAGIALFALFSIALFYDLYRAVAPSLDGLAASFAFNAALLVVPTTLMGLSLPLLARGLVASVGEIGPMVGRLYAVNTLGAAVGAAVSGWYLLGTYGFTNVVRIAALINLAAALLVFTLLRAVRAAPATDAEERAVASPAEGSRALTGAPAAGGPAWPWYVVYALTGAVALGLEIVFFRLIDTVMRSNSYSFGHVLSLYLALFGLGAAAGSVFVRRATRPERWFLGLQGAAGVSALVGVLALLAPLRGFDPLALGSELEAYFLGDGFATGFQGENHNVGVILFANIIAPLMIMGLPVLLGGASFPFVQALVARRVDTLGRRTGLLLFANIVGNVTGSLLTGFVLLDRVGTSGTIRLLAGLLVIPALAAALLSPRPARRAALSIGVVAAMAVPLYLFPGNQVLYGLLHSADPAEFALAEERSCVNALIPRNGIETVYINGSSQNGYPYDEYHLLIGLMPVLLHPAPERAMALGLGIGATPFGMAADPRVREINTIEICGGQIDLLEGLAESGSPETKALLDDDRVDIDVGDGREHLLAEGADYDIITVDTLRPQSGYSGNLYSVEFYDLVRSRLAEGGLLAQWAPTPRALETLTRSFAHVVQFTVPTYFNSPFLVASDTPIPFDRATIVQRLEATGLASRMDPAVYANVDKFVRTADPVPLTRPTGPAPNGLNRDLFPRDEYFLNNP